MKNAFWILNLCICCLSFADGRCQASDQSVAGIINFLTGPTDASSPLNKDLARSPDADRAAATALAEFGSGALPDIERALETLQTAGRPALRNAKWLLFAYARIKGRSAFQRLRAMAIDPRLRYLGTEVDESIALALDLTAYVSASRVADEFVCCRSEEPRHALSQLILAWLQGNRQRALEVLGPRAQTSLRALIGPASWLKTRTQIWEVPTNPGLALGFRFNETGDWSKPEETLEQSLADRRRFLTASQPPEASLYTEFVGASGHVCEGRQIVFARVPQEPIWLPTKYVVDDEDIEGLLRTITRCAKSD
jgi:hypothetical protein